MMPVYLVIWDVIYHGSSYGTTRDEIYADSEQEAVEEAIRQWREVRLDRTFYPLYSEPLAAN